MGSVVDKETSGPYDVSVVYLSLMEVPQEILGEWEKEWWNEVEPKGEIDAYEFFANKGAKWAYERGVDDTFETSHAFIEDAFGPDEAQQYLTDYERPGQQTLNDIAIKMLETIERDGRYLPEITETIRKALKSNA
jgi:hypothetical protein